MASRWIDASTKKEKNKGKPGSLRNIGRDNMDHQEPDADDEQDNGPMKKKKKRGFVENLNEPMAY